MKWFSFQAKADKEVEISIYDEIGMWGVTAKAFIAELKRHVGKAVTLTINSPGGSVFDALAIYNALRSHGSEINVKIMGVAASAASLIAMAGDKITMPENTFMMIHNPMTGMYGNADEMRDVADVLDKIAASLIGIYVARTGLPEDEIKSLLDAETWLNADDAVAKGFASEVEAAFKAAASFDLTRLPESVRSAYQNTETTPPPEETDPTPAEIDPTLADAIQKIADAAGLGAYAAVFALNPNVKTVDDANVLVTQAREISALCAVAKKPDMAQALIAKGASVVEARVAITDALAATDEGSHTSQVPRHSKDTQAPLGADVWAKIFPTAAQSKE